MRASVQIEEVQRYWDARPCNIRHGTAAVGSLEWSRQVTRRKYFVEPHIPEFAQFDRWNGKRVLEIGCGIGTDTISFLRAGARVDAIDVSEESLRLCNERLAAEGFWPDKLYSDKRRVNLYSANAELWCPANDYDLAYAFGVLHHTPNPEYVLRNLHRSLKPGGELRLMLYAKVSLKNLLGEQPEAQAGCPLARTYTGWSARRLLQDAGFFVESIRKAHIFPWRVADYVRHQYVKRWPYRMMPARSFAELERTLGWHLLIVARKPVHA